ncbi:MULTISPECIES: NACHT domain-containing protein [unclassified Amycolatopsis]|uniref:NACHT domain-containing protein n=1 Tax=unclassified Amycolatopsis TaxID=2618356 RepID=UPI002874CC04|nr:MULTISPECIES: NACHT domain-containing protein [unclassified Amycolatopsis]MDS0136818.1 NACHT domain-containing protein [Amycolatopsis sp. 505]MDS0143483.1 NACHT domain-containing protein [Amycolatopsis sp. CM201R]
MKDNRPPSTSNRIDGHVRTALQIGTVHGAVYVNTDLPEPEPAADPPRRWDDLPELPTAVQALLRAQAKSAEDLPYRLPGARRPALTAVYVRQEVGSGTDSRPAEPTRPLPVVDARGQLVEAPTRPVSRMVVRPPSRTVQAALDADDHLLVTGGPGQGKSTLSLQLTADIAAHWATQDGSAPLAEPVVPVRLTATKLATRLDLPFPQALAEAIQAEYGALLTSSIEPRTLGERIAGCRWLLFVDGLDEVADSHRRDRLIKVLAMWASDEASAHLRIVVTTRPIAGAALAAFQGTSAARYELLPFDEDALRRFAAKWFVEDDTPDRFVRQIHDANLDELVRVPLLATIAAIIFEQHSDRRLPDNRYELYEAYLEYLRFARPIAASSWDEHRESLLEHLGRVRLGADTSLESAAQDWATTHVPHSCGNPHWREELTTYLTTVGPLVSRGGDLAFLHHSFADHLAATADARELPDEFDPAAWPFVRLLHAARPVERGRHARLVLLHYTRLRPAETDRLIGYLGVGNTAKQVLAARLLAWHAPASRVVADAFLADARAWAMTTQYPAQVILAWVSRAAHHPGLADWLLELMRDEEAPWESRIEAGRAMAVRLYGAERLDAVALLQSVVDDEAIPVEFRFEAAAALADCSTGERAAAVAGLLSVLADSVATAPQCRDAAIVLAGLGPEARLRATVALVRLLDDPGSPQEYVLEAAIGLLEISGGFEERCTKAFRAVLARRNSPAEDVRRAASSLASLGSRQLGEAAAALKARLVGQRPDHVRVSVARELAELGPRHRHEAGQLLFAWASRPGASASSRVTLARALGDFGTDFRDRALDLLHDVSANRLARTNTLLWLAAALTEFGPEHHEEAARMFTLVAGHPRAAHFERTTAWGRLADLGEPHRTPALLALRGKLTNRDVDPDLRIRAGTELIRLGPQFHTEAIQHLLEVASSRATDPQARVSAWRALQPLGTVLRHRASAALLELLGPQDAVAWEAHDSEIYFYGHSDPGAAAARLAALLSDRHRGVRHRVAAAHSLLVLGRDHHDEAVAGLIELLNRREVPVGELASAVDDFSEVSTSRRAELAGVLAAAVIEHTSPELLCETAEALDALDVPDPRVNAAMHTLVSDGSATGIHRAQAAMFLARSRRVEPEAALDTIIALQHAISPGLWTAYVRELVVLGADLPEVVRTITSASDAEHWLRQLCADLLATCGPDPKHEALAELRSQAQDDHLQFTWRTEAIMQLAQLDPTTIDDAIAFHRRMLDDETELPSDRGEAAYLLARLDPAQHQDALAVLRRLAGSPGLYDTERADVLVWLSRNNFPSAELATFARATVHAPLTSAVARQRTAPLLPAAEFRAVSRTILGDRTAPVSAWSKTTAGYWDSWVIAVELEAELRDALAGAEFSTASRVAAATALGRLSPRLVPEAIALLTELGGSGHARRQRLLALAELDHAWRVRLLADARATLDGEGRSWRCKLEAAVLLLELDPEPLTETDRRRLDQLLSDHRLTDHFRLRILLALDRLDDIRTIRDDDRAHPPVRAVAASDMAGYQCEDRERGARVLAAIAEDPASRPALRRYAAEELATFGARGREFAVERLRAMMSDETLPVLARAYSARTLGDIRPDTRDEVLAFLRRLETDGMAAVQVLKAIGKHEPEEAALALRVMAEDQAQPPVVRFRSATAMSALHGDYREAAALVCRELAHAGTVPCHVQAHAAQTLARLSALCRHEARELLTEIRSRQPSRASAAAQSAVPDGS